MMFMEPWRADMFMEPVRCGGAQMMEMDALMMLIDDLISMMMLDLLDDGALALDDPNGPWYG